MVAYGLYSTCSLNQVNMEEINNMKCQFYTKIKLFKNIITHKYYFNYLYQKPIF